MFAAASLTDALEEADRAFTAATHIQVKSSYAARSVLAKQIEAGAHADVFFSADRDGWTIWIARLLPAAPATDLLGNALVLIAPSDRQVQLKIAPGFALRRRARVRTARVRGPDSVPAGL